LIGVTRQLLGANGAGLLVAYRGSVGPISDALPPAATARMLAIGAELVRAFGLAGPFGVDVVLVGYVPYPVEINPRYTASMEVLERAGRPLAFHSLLVEESHFPSRTSHPPGATGSAGAGSNRGTGRAGGTRSKEPFSESKTTLDGDRSPGPSSVVAKRILFARRPALAPVDWPWTDPTDPNPEVADLPAPGVCLASKDPVLTVFAEGRSVAEAMAGLARRARTWRRRIDAWRCP